jgi:hypothetical protein
LSYVRKDRALSIFTHHLIEAFHGAGNQSGDNVARLASLMSHPGKAVPAGAQAGEGRASAVACPSGRSRRHGQSRRSGYAAA